MKKSKIYLLSFFLGLFLVCFASNEVSAQSRSAIRKELPKKAKKTSKSTRANSQSANSRSSNQKKKSQTRNSSAKKRNPSRAKTLNKARKKKSNG